MSALNKITIFNNRQTLLSRTLMQLVSSTNHGFWCLKLSFLVGATLGTVYMFYRSSHLLAYPAIFFSFFFANLPIMAQFWGEFAITGAASALVSAAIMKWILRGKSFLSTSLIWLVSVTLANLLTTTLWMIYGGSLTIFHLNHPSASLLSTAFLQAFYDCMIFYGLPGMAGGASTLGLVSLMQMLRPNNALLLLGRKS